MRFSLGSMLGVLVGLCVATIAAVAFARNPGAFSCAFAIVGCSIIALAMMLGRWRRS